MTEPVIGSGVVEVAIDATKLKAGIGESKSALRSLREEAKTVGESLNKQSESYLKSLTRQTESIERQAATFGKSRSEVAAYTAAQLGVSGTAATMIERIAASEKSLTAQAAAARLAATGTTALTGAQDRYAMSARASAAALRGVPAQLTDIVISLQGGQAPLNVLLQQGGQLKDMFGGIGPAARALGGHVAGLVNPFTLAALAAGTLAVAYYQGSQESTEYQKAIILTGNYAGVTAGRLSDMAIAVSSTIGTEAQAAGALAQLAASGKIAGTELQAAAASAVAMEKATGKAISASVADFVKLADEPTKASAKLNETMHYLTQSVFEQIAALEAHGQKQQAVALAQNTYAEATLRQNKQIQESLGWIETGWNAVAGAVKRAGSAMGDVGRDESPAQRLKKEREALEALVARGPLNGSEQGMFDKSVAQAKARIDVLASDERQLRRIAGVEGERSAMQQSAIAATEAINKAIEGSASKQQKMNLELERTKANFDALRKVSPTSPLLAKESEAYANIRAKPEYKETAKPVTDSAATRMLQTLREQAAVLNTQLADETKLTGAQREQASFQQLIADLKEKKILTADQKSLLAAQDQISAQLLLNVAADKSVALKKLEAEAEKKRGAALDQTKSKIEAINRSMADALESQNEQYDRNLSVYGKGSQAVEEMQSTKAIYREYGRFQRDLTEQAARNKTLESDAFKTATTEISLALDRSLQDNEAYYARLKDLQGDWKNGATSAMQDYLDESANTARQTGDVFANVFHGLEDVMVNAAMTGKLSFGDMAKSIIADIVRIQSRQANAGLIGLVSDFFSGGGANFAAGGTGLEDAAGSLFSATGEAVRGRRALGGPVSARGLYEVNEERPELLKVAGKQFLMMGSQPGTIDPNVGGSSGAQGVTITQHINIDSRSDQATIMEAMVRAKDMALAAVERKVRSGSRAYTRAS